MSNSPQSKKAKSNWYPPWAPRFWNGMLLGDYFKLLRENRFRIHPVKYPMTILGTGCSTINSILTRVQRLTHGRKIAAIELEQPPIFIIGHWRSGTTLMHELMAMDERLAFPNNFDAFLPHHFLVSRPVLYPFVKMLMPGKRPMDNMKMGVEFPQEDDFALCVYGAPTPYRRIAFPNRPNRDHLDLDLSSASPQTQQQVRSSMEHFLKMLTAQYKSQLVLKSPPHTGRLSNWQSGFPVRSLSTCRGIPIAWCPRRCGCGSYSINSRVFNYQNTTTSGLRITFLNVKI